MSEEASPHEPVLVEEVLACLDPRPGERALDGTVGAGGHAHTIWTRIRPGGELVAVDRDPNALNLARSRFGDDDAVRFLHASFVELPQLVKDGDLDPFDVALFDLGLSSMQLDNPERGFSFQEDGPLDMRMNPEQETTAAHLVNRLPRTELADLIYEYGEERRSRQVASAIIKWRRKHGPVETTGQLADIVRSVVRRSGRIDPATRTFQALRIAVNRELESLDHLLLHLPRLLNEGGRVAIISFHSLEDRRVKHSFRDQAKSGQFELLTKKPIQATEEEKRRNPRSRSAKLRAAKRLA